MCACTNMCVPVLNMHACILTLKPTLGYMHVYSHYLQHVRAHTGLGASIVSECTEVLRCLHVNDHTNADPNQHVSSVEDPITPTENHQGSGPYKRNDAPSDPRTPLRKIQESLADATISDPYQPSDALSDPRTPLSSVTKRSRARAKADTSL